MARRRRIRAQEEEAGLLELGVTNDEMSALQNPFERSSLRATLARRGVTKEKPLKSHGECAICFAADVPRAKLWFVGSGLGGLGPYGPQQQPLPLELLAGGVGAGLEERQARRGGQRGGGEVHTMGRGAACPEPPPMCSF